MQRRFEPSHLYVQIRDELARRIVGGEFAPGSQLPNEFALAQGMQVSVGTVRKAVEALVGENLVTRKQGRGTTVADPRSFQISGKFDRIRNADGTPIAWKINRFHVEVRNATSNEIRMLRLDADDKIIALRRSRQTGGKTAKWEYSRLPFSLFGPADDWDSEETTESLALARGLQISSWNERVTLERAPALAADEWEVELDTPIMRLERVLYDRFNRPVEWRVAYCEMTGRQYQLPSPTEGTGQVKDAGLTFPEPKDG